MTTGDDQGVTADALELFGPRLREARKQRGLSLRAFALQLGVSPSAVSQMESGKTRPSMKRLHDIVRVLDIGLEEVFDTGAPTGSGKPRPSLRQVVAGPEHPLDENPLVHGTLPDFDSIPFVSNADQSRLRLEDGIEWVRIAPLRLPQLEVLRTVYPPGARASEDAEYVQHRGWEMGHVIEGRMRVQVAFAYQDVGPGESVCFDSSVPHRLSNPFDEPAIAIWIRSTRLLDE